MGRTVTSLQQMTADEAFGLWLGHWVRSLPVRQPQPCLALQMLCLLLQAQVGQ
jgi:hypothetical protein